MRMVWPNSLEDKHLLTYIGLFGRIRSAELGLYNSLARDKSIVLVKSGPKSYGTFVPYTEHHEVKHCG